MPVISDRYDIYETLPAKQASAFLGSDEGKRFCARAQAAGHNENTAVYFVMNRLFSNRRWLSDDELEFWRTFAADDLQVIEATYSLLR